MAAILSFTLLSILMTTLTQTSIHSHDFQKCDAESYGGCGPAYGSRSSCNSPNPRTTQTDSNPNPCRSRYWAYVSHTSRKRRIIIDLPICHGLLSRRAIITRYCWIGRGRRPRTLPNLEAKVININYWIISDELVSIWNTLIPKKNDK